MTKVENIVAVAWLAFPWWLTLQLLRPWRRRPGIRKAVDSSVEAAMWLNGLWATWPIVLLWSAFSGFSWLEVIFAYVVIALIFGSTVSGATKAIHREWEEAI